jgi:transcriptional regulator with XRE-family HTH domain
VTTPVNRPRQIIALRQWRTKAALSQADLAKISGVERATIARIEGGSQTPRPSTLRKLAAALGIEPSQLFTDPFA